MSKVVQRADYDDGVIRASIRITQVYAGRPLQYVLVAFSNVSGQIPLDKSSFPTVDNAIAYVTRFGFQAHLWSYLYLPQ